MYRWRYVPVEQRWSSSCVGGIRSEEVFTRHFWRNDFGEWEVKRHRSITPGLCLFHQLVENVPIAVGKFVSDLLAGKGPILVAEHGNLSIKMSRVT